ncbi:CatB-related O-acetyltransferase [Phaeobacter piscinae]|uniref:CatB-related O-acetyltransferase n=1 Tax=Phaeobacter piscinae TaxID=1580596 RepID=UPI000C9C70D8|nr:CatB-related O-acetyltransferase [Phaeobacter piscinae]AUQ75323.1 putative antibiotic acetyltransferase [Phaeobacter piscinae]
MPLPDPRRRNPITLPDGTAHASTVMLAEAIDHPNFTIGAYSYASAFEPPSDWASRLAPYLFAGSRERVVIGKFCQIADSVRFITASANHAQDGLSCYPFPVFDQTQMAGFQPDTRDTIVGNDVWIGYGAMILPGAKIGDGAIIGAGAVVRGSIPPYAIATGNPAAAVRHRFSKPQIARLLALKWWDWPADLISRAEPALLAGDLDMLEALAPD